MPAPDKIAVAGATGRVGRHIAAVLAERGYDVAAISRARGVDVITGDGLDAARAVAEVAADLAAGPELGDGPFTEVAGPRVESLPELAALLAARRGDPAKVEGVSHPADPDRELNEGGGLLPGPGAILAGPTFEEWPDTVTF